MSQISRTLASGLSRRGVLRALGVGGASGLLAVAGLAARAADRPHERLQDRNEQRNRKQRNKNDNQNDNDSDKNKNKDKNGGGGQLGSGQNTNGGGGGGNGGSNLVLHPGRRRGP